MADRANAQSAIVKEALISREDPVGAVAFKPISVFTYAT